MPDKPNRIALTVIFLTVMIDLLGFGIVLPLLPVYADDFLPSGTTAFHRGLIIGLLMSSFSAMQFLFAPIWGRISDRVGRRPVILIGLAGSVIFYMLFGIATMMGSILWIFVARIGAGIAGATISTAQAYIADVTPLESRTKGMAMIGAAFGVGFTFGPLVGFLAVPTGDGAPGPWPGYVAAGLSAVALLLAIFKLPESLNPDSEHAAQGVENLSRLRQALARPTIGLLLLASFACVFSFGGFEATLSLLLKFENGPYHFNFRELCLTFAYIGFVLTLVQGGIVRRVATRVSDRSMAAFGAMIEVLGFAMLAWVSERETMLLGLLLVALAIVVAGFAFITPAINSMVSRRTDPSQQGSVLGLLQSVNSLARIFGPLVGIALFVRGASFPLWAAAGLMAVGLVIVLIAGKDVAAAEKSE
jgi:DHA1 family tetracycline resistance protein-like MFS transporter